jgi:hypothetical protein
MGVGLVLCSRKRAKDLVIYSAYNNDKVAFVVDVVVEGGGVVGVVLVQEFGFLDFAVGAFFDEVGEVVFVLVLVVEHIAIEETVEHEVFGDGFLVAVGGGCGFA